MHRTSYRCGSTQHTANFKECPAKEVLSKKKGHFAKVCLGSKHASDASEVEAVPVVTILNVNTSVSLFKKEKVLFYCFLADLTLYTTVVSF